jgi:hypothetical protein
MKKDCFFAVSVVQ